MTNSSSSWISISPEQELPETTPAPAWRHMPSVGTWAMSKTWVKMMWDNSLKSSDLGGGFHIPSRGLPYPTLGKGKSSSKCHFWGIYMLVSWRVLFDVLPWIIGEGCLFHFDLRIFVFKAVGKTTTNKWCEKLIYLNWIPVTLAFYMADGIWWVFTKASSCAHQFAQVSRDTQTGGKA